MNVSIAWQAPAARKDMVFGLRAALVSCGLPEENARVWAEMIATVQPLCVPQNAGLYTEIRLHHDIAGEIGDATVQPPKIRLRKKPA